MSHFFKTLCCKNTFDSHYWNHFVCLFVLVFTRELSTRKQSPHLIHFWFRTDCSQKWINKIARNVTSLRGYIHGWLQGLWVRSAWILASVSGFEVETQEPSLDRSIVRHKEDRTSSPSSCSLALYVSIFNLFVCLNYLYKISIQLLLFPISILFFPFKSHQYKFNWLNKTLSN